MSNINAMNKLTELADWQIRVLEERDDLRQKLHKLRNYLDSDTSKVYVKASGVLLLEDQEYFMQRYLDVLNQRIAEFSKDMN